jgi:hypothetical protein
LPQLEHEENDIQITEKEYKFENQQSEITEKSEELQTQVQSVSYLTQPTFDPIIVSTSTIEQNEDGQEKEESHPDNNKSKQKIIPNSKYKNKITTPVKVTEDQDERFYLLIQGNKR